MSDPGWYHYNCAHPLSNSLPTFILSHFHTTLLPHLPRGHPVHSPFADSGQTFSLPSTCYSHSVPPSYLPTLIPSYLSTFILSYLPSLLPHLPRGHPVHSPSSVRSPPSALSFFVYHLRATRTPPHLHTLTPFNFRTLRSLPSSLRSQVSSLKPQVSGLFP